MFTFISINQARIFHFYLIMAIAAYSLFYAVDCILPLYLFKPWPVFFLWMNIHKYLFWQPELCLVCLIRYTHSENVKMPQYAWFVRRFSAEKCELLQISHEGAIRCKSHRNQFRKWLSEINYRWHKIDYSSQSPLVAEYQWYGNYLTLRNGSFLFLFQSGT